MPIIKYLICESNYINDYYRYLYNGIGIYEAYKLKCSKREWGQFKQYVNNRWLPVPPVYEDKIYKDKKLKSYFTEEGKEMFEKLVLPIMLKKLDKRHIDIEKASIRNVEIAYRDRYQVVVFSD